MDCSPNCHCLWCLHVATMPSFSYSGSARWWQTLKQESRPLYTLPISNRKARTPPSCIFHDFVISMAINFMSLDVSHFYRVVAQADFFHPFGRYYYGMTVRTTCNSIFMSWKFCCVFQHDISPRQTQSEFIQILPLVC